MLEETQEKNSKNENLNFEADQNLFGLFSVLFQEDRRQNPNTYKNPPEEQGAGKIN